MSTAEQKPLALTLADRLTANAEIDAAEGGNPDVIKLELDAAAELRRLSAENEALRSKAARLARWESAIGAVMMPDLKDWHDNDPAEWPDIAAVVITTLREQRDEEVELSGQLATQLATRDAELATLRAQVGMIHHAIKDAGWHPGRTDDLLTDIIRAKGEEMAALRAQVEAQQKDWDAAVANAFKLRGLLEAGKLERDSLSAQVGVLTAERTVTHRKIAEASEAMSWAMANCDLAGHSYFFERKLEVLRGVLANAPTPSPLTRPAVPEGWDIKMNDDGEVMISSPVSQGPGCLTVAFGGGLAQRMLHSLCRAMLTAPKTPAQVAGPVVTAELAGLFREALAWGKVWGQRLAGNLWDEMREEMVLEFTRRAVDPQPPGEVSSDDLVLVPRGLLGSACAVLCRSEVPHTETLAELRRYTVGDLSAAAPQPEAQPSDRDAIFKALQETQEALNVSQCPWCGEWGPQYRDSDLPAAYCHHEFTLRPWKAFATGKPEAQPTEAAQPDLMSIINAQADEHAKRSPLDGAAQKGGA